MNTSPVILVTGASRGLGRGIAQSCARIGCSVAIHYQGNETAAQETKQLCEKEAAGSQQNFALVQGNLALSKDRIRMVEQTLATLGRLDGLVNNAGMAPRVRADLTETGEESYDEVMSVNLKGPFFISQLAARHWLKHPNQSRLPGGYKLIFITSISSDTASVNRGEYCLSKAGLAMACQLWATRLADEGAQVFDIRPGIMETDMTAGVKEKYDKLIAEGLVPQKRWGKPEHVGLAVEAILKGYFPYSTGEVITVDGGFHLRRL
ncbi:MAG: Short-chain dehydrogenase/reductase [Pedosphaera sp.]|nr:Short-chain dehydrogenase/reductase [Pedosphaera sp.]